MTNEPLVTEDLNFVSPLHVFLRSWDIVFKLIVRLRVPFFSWEDSKFSRMKPMIERERQECINVINAQSGDKVEIPDPTGHGGTSTIGQVIKQLYPPKKQFSPKFKKVR